MKRSALALSALPLLLLAACSSNPATAAPATQATTPVTVQSPVVTTSAGPAHTTPATSAPADTPPATTAAAKAPATTQPATTAPASPAIKLVDAAAYKQDGAAGVGYYFQSPSGNISCGLSADGRIRGCQSAVVVAGEPCGDNPRVRTTLVTFEGGRAVKSCTTQGNFSASNGLKALPYGSSITYQGFTCTSLPDGMKCTGPTGTYFSLAREGAIVG